jgi:hypothetical protein
LATIAAEYGRHSIDFQFCPFDKGATAQVIEISLDPLGLQIAQRADLEIYRYDLVYTARLRMFQDDLKYALRYRKLVHLPLLSCSCPKNERSTGIAENQSPAGEISPK